MTYATDQAEFMQAGGQTVDGFNAHQAARYVRHITEEARETAEAFDQGRHVHVIDGAVDTIVVALGLLLSYGINPDDAWKAVHTANMRKLVDGKPYIRPDGQIGKPPGWVGPEKELAQLIEPWLRINDYCENVDRFFQTKR